MKKKIGIIGITGKVGKQLTYLLPSCPEWELIGGMNQQGFTPPSLLQEVDLLLDFSSPNTLACYLEKAIQRRIPIVIGTTGYSPFQWKLLEKAAKKTPLFYSANFSLGIALFKELLQKTTQMFPHSDKHIVEIHHAQKKDSPSGTALDLAKEIQKAPEASEATIHSLRAAKELGEHQIYFYMEEEKIFLQHTTLSRNVFAKGALQAAQYLLTKPPGLYSMKDLLPS